MLKKRADTNFRVRIIFWAGIITMALFSVPAGAAEFYERFRPAANQALAALENALAEEKDSVYVYRDFGDTANHFSQKAKMAGKDDSLVHDMDENWKENPHSGSSCIRCTQDTIPMDWGGWLFLNGWLEEGNIQPQLNTGDMDGQGLNLGGARTLRFWARGDKGGEKVEFFTCGFGFPGDFPFPAVPYPDSAPKISLGVKTLTPEWQEYVIDLEEADTSYVVCGFGYVLNGDDFGYGSTAFYLDDIRFTDFSGDGAEGRYMLRSYETENIYIRNAAFTYDNALTAMAFLSAGKISEAEALLDAFVYAVENDRYCPGRIRNAYAAGDITAFPGWDGAARMPGWYDAESGNWYEDRYQTGSNVGNTSYAALALLQGEAVTGKEDYLETAKALMDWVLENCSDNSPGFTAGYDGWPEGGEETTYVFTYKSMEHNIDAYAAFSRLYECTGDEKYAEAAESALNLILSLYDAEKNLFYTGTLDDGITPNTGNIVLDTQVWTCLALGDSFAPFENVLKTAAAMKTPEGGYPFCASNRNGGWWAEGTAFTALTYRLRGEDDAAGEALEALMSIQLENGLFPAATVEHLSTGFDLFDGSPWEYGNAPHLAPTAWFVMAANGFNPYAFVEKR